MSRPPARDLGPLHVSVETALSPEESEAFWGVYQEAFAPMRTRAAARQAFTREEFMEEAVDPRVTKFVARDASGRAWGMTTLTNDLSTLPWIEPAYYAHRFPDEHARDAVFYNGFSAVHPDAQGSACFALVMEAMVRTVAAVSGVLAFDMCRFNVEVAGIHRGVVALTERFARVEEHDLDVQTYFAYTVRPHHVPPT